jgi:hypothetical protein
MKNGKGNEHDQRKLEGRKMNILLPKFLFLRGSVILNDDNLFLSLKGFAIET